MVLLPNGADALIWSVARSRNPTNPLDLRFLDPAFLFLLIAVPLLWWWPARVRDLRLGILRTLVFAALVVALARPVVFVEDDRQHLVYVLDQSASVDAGARASARQACSAWLQGVADGDVVHLMTLGDEDAADADPDWARADVRTHWQDSALGAALATAARWIPEGARAAVTVVSDGAGVSPDWATATQDLSRRGVPVHTVVLERPAGDVRPVGVTVPADARVGHSVQVGCELEGTGTVDAVLAGPAGELDRIEGIRLAGRAAVTFSFEPDVAGFVPLTVRIECGTDTRPDNNTWSVTAAIQDPLRLLYLGHRMTAADARWGELLGAGFDIVADGADDGGLGDPDLVVLDDRPATTLPDALQRDIVTAVQDRGTGLFVAGGKQAFGPGGYHGSTLASVLPTESIQKEEKRDPSTSLVLIIDTSGSMGGMRVTLAKEVARLAMRRLLPHDRVGIVEFYGAKRWAAPLQPASNLIELQRALNRLDAGGGTVILPAIEEAFYGLQNVDTRYKHVLILTDGGVETGAFEPLLRKMAAKGINTSTVLVGGDAHSEFLVTLSNWGKGRFYSVPNRFNLPEIILKQPATAQLPAYRPGRHPVRGRGSRGWWGETPLDALPPVRGFVETKARPGADVLVETADGAHPLVASWRHGLGRVTAMMTEPTGPGTAAWADWSDYGRWLGRMLARTAIPDPGPFDYRAERRAEGIVVTAVRRRMGSTGIPRAVVGSGPGEGVGPDDGAELAFRERAPGWFEAAAPWSVDREARIVADQGTGPWRLVSPSTEARAPETQVAFDAMLDLEALAAATGGARTDGSDPSLATSAGGGLRRLRQLWPWLLLVALVTYLGELLYRRWPANTEVTP